MTEKTSINQDINRLVNGYMVNAIPSSANGQKVAELQAKLAAQFGDGLWLTPPTTLHITLMDWIAPLVEYGTDKETLFNNVFPEYDEVLSEILQEQPPITVHFDTLKVTPGAIILIGHDDGSFKRIRDNFLKRINLIADTKKPPTIIHSTIARYKTEQDLRPLVDFVADQELVFDCAVSLFRLVQERVTPMLEYNLLKEYHLGGVR
jgi:2'-5' RNA ligase